MFYQDYDPEEDSVRQINWIADSIKSSADKFLSDLQETDDINVSVIDKMRGDLSELEAEIENLASLIKQAAA